MVRDNELHSYLGNRGMWFFDQDIKFVTIHPNLVFWAKNESTSFRHKLLVIKSFKLSSGALHCLCPILAFKALVKTFRYLNVDIFLVNPRTFKPCSASYMSRLIRRLRCVSLILIVLLMFLGSLLLLWYSFPFCPVGTLVVWVF